MKGSFKLGQFAGIGVFVHWTFPLLLVWILIAQLTRSNDVSQAIWVVAFVIAIFGCVVLHEFGHALTAKRFGIRTRDITLLPIGGIARLERIPEKPTNELLIALAGPAVNVVIAACLFVVLGLSGEQLGTTEAELANSSFLTQLMLLNVILAVFNLLPAFPMDGGRVLRAMLAFRMDYVAATRTAASVGQMMAIVLGILGLFSNLFLVLIAIFVYFGAAQEANLVEVRAVLSGMSVGNAMVTRFHTLSEDALLDVVIDELLTGEQQDFPVVSGTEVVGVLTRAHLLEAISAGRRNNRVGSVMQTDFPRVEEHESLKDVWQRMQENHWSTLPVVRDGNPIGILTAENVGELIMIQAAESVGATSKKSGSESRSM